MLPASYGTCKASPYAREMGDYYDFHNTDKYINNNIFDCCHDVF